MIGTASAWHLPCAGVMAVLTLIENGELYDPVPRGKQSLLLANDRVEKVGHVDRRALDALENS